MPPGYYRFPTIHGNQIVYVCEDDLWTVSTDGGPSRRLTSNLGAVTTPSLSPDGDWLSFVGWEEGQPEIYVMPSSGGPAQRLTYLGSSSIQAAGWTPDGRIVFASNVSQPFPSVHYLYTISHHGGSAEKVDAGPAKAIAYGPDGSRVIGRNVSDPARWKRYRGGTAGQLWIENNGSGNFRPLLQLAGNLACPMWIGERIYFLSDHEGVGNIYSCLPSGQDIQRHSDHEIFYARNASTDGSRIVYHAGADLFLYEPDPGTSIPIRIEQLSPQVQRNRKFVDPERYLEDAVLHPKGHSLALTVRGHLYSFANWEGAVIQHGNVNAGVRYRLPQWLNDGKRLIAVDDASGEETFVILDTEKNKELERFEGLDTGRPIELVVNPTKDQVVFSNHRYELMLLDLVTRELYRIDQGKNDRMAGFDWSPDGVWIVYSVSTSIQLMALKLWNSESREIYPLTQPVLKDIAPSFDPDGKYIYFLSFRTFDPVIDTLQFELTFPRGVKPYLIPLRKDLTSPFIPTLKPLDEEQKEDKTNTGNRQDSDPDEHPEGNEEAGSEEISEEPSIEETHAKWLQVDLEGIQQRIIAFPVEEGRYGRVMGAQGGKVFYSRYPLEGTLGEPMFSTEPPSKGRIMVYDMEEQKEDTLAWGITDFRLNTNHKVMMVRAGNCLRVFKAGVKGPEDGDHRPGRKSGWIDLERVRVMVQPEAEWRQMFREAWRLQRDHFWNPEMSDINWLAVYNCYSPLVDRVASRSEFSDLMWELQGELGTSHCYEMGGDYRPAPSYALGSLGADFHYDQQLQTWRVTHIVQGDNWDENASSPLAKAGLNIQPGDQLLAINGQWLTESYSPSMALVNQAGIEVNLQWIRNGQDEPSQVTVKTISSDTSARYREWVENNRKKVHQASDGKAGYLHIPDMGFRGFAEFHRAFLAEVEKPGLIIDLRYNGGGMVSSLLLEKLARRRIGYDKSRWDQDPRPYPAESVLGPMVALTNEFAGSDGDIFSHGFKLMGLGPLIGKRTWGGVVGIWPRQTLVDGTLTTQPEFSFWFKDVGWGVENYGTDPDIEIDNAPQDYIQGIDAQLNRAIEEILRLMESNPPEVPVFGQRPSRAMPKLPPRNR